MRYWAYLAAKLVAAGLVLWGVLLLLGLFLPIAPTPVSHEKDYRHLMAPLANGSANMAASLAYLAWLAVCVVALFFIVRDQRYRCRVCLRRLRMPIETGSWGSMLQLGRPRVEYICPYGHGTLRTDEVQISGLATPEWTPQSGDIWEELASSIVKPDQK